MSGAAADNTAQVDYWNGQAGEKWASEADRLDAMLAPFAETVLEAADIRGGERVLDVGCGSGALSLAARDAGAGEVLGIDVSAPMLALARKRARGHDDVSFVEADASSWQSEVRFDRLISRYGVMFFADPVAAFTNLREQMKPGAGLAFVCWQPLEYNSWALTPLRAALSLTDKRPEPHEPGAPGPFAFEDAERTTAILGEAGWTGATATPWSGQIVLPGQSLAEAAGFATRMGPTARLIAELELNADRVREAVESRLSDHVGPDGRVRLDAAAWTVIAKA